MMAQRTYGRGGGRSSAGMIVRERDPLNLEMPFGSLDGFITPADRIFVRCHFSIPQIEVKTWRLKSEGADRRNYMVNHHLPIEVHVR